MSALLVGCLALLFAAGEGNHGAEGRLGAAALSRGRSALVGRVGGVAATVDGEAVDASELLPALFLTDTEALFGALETALRGRLIEIEAAAHGVDVSAARVTEATGEVLAARRDEFKLQAGPEADFEAYVRERFGVEREPYHEAIRTRVLEDLLLERLVRFELGRRERVRVRILVVDDVDRARELLDMLREGANFAALARKFSLDRSAAKGGLFPPLPADSPHPLLVGIGDLKPGDLAEVAVVDRGSLRLYRLLQLVERLPADPRPYAARREEIEEGLRRRAIDPFEILEWDRIVRERHHVEVRLGRRTGAAGRLEGQGGGE